MRTLLALAAASTLAACASVPDVRVTEIKMIGNDPHEAFRARAYDRKTAMDYAKARCAKTGLVPFIYEEYGATTQSTFGDQPLSAPHLNPQEGRAQRGVYAGVAYYWVEAWCVTPELQARYEKLPHPGKR